MEHQFPPSYDFKQVYLAVAIAFLVVIITFLLSKKLKKSTNVVLLTGLSDSGKTTIFSKLIFNTPKKSVTSLKENEATNKDLNLRIIDLPGADRLRTRYWEQYRIKANHVVFVVDSTTIHNRLRDVSEYLYTLLSDGLIRKNKVRFTIACSKQDLDDAEHKDEIGPILEKELNAIRDTKKGQLGKTSEEEEEDYLASLSGDEITFNNLKVDLIETSINNLDHLIGLIL